LGVEQYHAFDLFKEYLSLVPVLMALKGGLPFSLYITANDKIIGAILTKETNEKEYIIHRFDIPRTSTIDQGTSFMAKVVHEFAELYKIILLNSSPYYTQVNSEARSSNRTLISLIEREMCPWVISKYFGD
jgi:hypothetical protein